MTDLSHYTYGDLVAALRKDLQLDLSTDVLPGNYAALLNLGIDRGTFALTFAASTNAGGVTVQHRLGAEPSAVVFGAMNSPAFGQIPLCSWASPTPTTFMADGELKTAFTGTINVTWIAAR